MKGLPGRIIAAKSGITQAYLSEIERGLKTPSTDTLKKIAKALNTSIAYLIGEKDDSVDEAHVNDPDPAVQAIKENKFLRNIVIMMNEMNETDLAEMVHLIADKKELSELRKLKGA